MATHYTEKQMSHALTQLHIQPINGRVTATEAARILSWRAEEEYNVTHRYTANNVRKHRNKLDPRPASIRMTTYDVSKVFGLDIAPQRTNKGDREKVWMK